MKAWHIAGIVGAAAAAVAASQGFPRHGGRARRRRRSGAPGRQRRHAGAVQQRRRYVARPRAPRASPSASVVDLRCVEHGGVDLSRVHLSGVHRRQALRTSAASTTASSTAASTSAASTSAASTAASTSAAATSSSTSSSSGGPLSCPMQYCNLGDGGYAFAYSDSQNVAPQNPGPSTATLGTTGLCISGSVGQITNMDYTDDWGCGIGINLNQAMGTNTPKNTYVPTGTGVTVDTSAVPSCTTARVILDQNGTGYCAPLTPGVETLPLGQLQHGVLGQLGHLPERAADQPVAQGPVRGQHLAGVHVHELLHHRRHPLIRPAGAHDPRSTREGPSTSHVASTRAARASTTPVHLMYDQAAYPADSASTCHRRLRPPGPTSSWLIWPSPGVCRPPSTRAASGSPGWLIAGQDEDPVALAGQRRRAARLPPSGDEPPTTSGSA